MSLERLYIATDHAAFDTKEALKAYLAGRFEVVDLGTHSAQSVHYPDYAQKLAQEVVKTQGRGILLCGSGIGVSIVANRFAGIRAALCRDEDDAKMCRQHNNANVLCLGGRKTPVEQLKRMVDVFLGTEFEGGRHADRVALFNHLGC